MLTLRWSVMHGAICSTVRLTSLATGNSKWIFGRNRRWTFLCESEWGTRKARDECNGKLRLHSEMMPAEENVGKKRMVEIEVEPRAWKQTSKPCKQPLNSIEMDANPKLNWNPKLDGWAYRPKVEHFVGAIGSGGSECWTFCRGSWAIGSKEPISWAFLSRRRGHQKRSIVRLSKRNDISFVNVPCHTCCQLIRHRVGNFFQTPQITVFSNVSWVTDDWNEYTFRRTVPPIRRQVFIPSLNCVKIIAERAWWIGWAKESALREN